MNPLIKKTLLRVVSFVLAASIGAVIFSEIERPSQDESEVKAKLLRALRKDMENRYNMTQEDFKNFSQLSYNALSPAGPAWNYFDGLRFAFETLTTIGYGDLSPATSLGQSLCIVFAVLGIPVTILAFQSVGELISQGTTSLIMKIEKKRTKREPSNVEAKSAGVTFMLMLVMLLVGATMQTFTDNWTFLEGFYFWVITFTTIGYGDYIPDYPRPLRDGNKSMGLTKSVALLTGNAVFQIIWTTFGLCVVSSVLNALATFIDKRRPCRVCTGCSQVQQEKHCSDNDHVMSETNGNETVTSL